MALMVPDQGEEEDVSLDHLFFFCDVYALLFSPPLSPLLPFAAFNSFWLSLVCAIGHLFFPALSHVCGRESLATTQSDTHLTHLYTRQDSEEVFISHGLSPARTCPSCPCHSLVHTHVLHLSNSLAFPYLAA